MRVRSGPALALTLVLAAVSGSVATGSAATGSPADRPAVAAEGAERIRVRGDASTFTVPREPRWAGAGTRVDDDGGTVRRWRRALPGGLSCALVAAERPAPDTGFPATAVAVFAAGRAPGERVERNEVVPPPQGAVAAVRQERRVVFGLGAAGTAPGMLLQRQVVTRGGTLVVLTAAGPARAGDDCGLAAIVDSLEVDES